MSDFVTAWNAAEDRHIASMAPNPPGIKANYEVDFAYQGRVKTFHRAEVTPEAAVRGAKTGFQWTYGYWPDEPLAVRAVDNGEMV